MARDGVRGFVSHRVRRLLLPLVAAWLVVFPMVMAGFHFASTGGTASGFDATIAAIAAAPYARPNLGHLWFLYDLILLCAAAAVAVPLVSRLPGRLRERLGSGFGRFAPTVWGCLTLGLLTGATLIPMKEPSLDTAVDFVPTPRVLVAYGVFFVFGWLLFRSRERLEAFSAHPWRYLSSGLVLAIPYFGLGMSTVGGARHLHVPTVMLGGVSTWLIIFGLLGLSLRYLAAPRRLQRYLSDASYWMYLVHLPLTIWLPGLLHGFDLPALLKFSMVLGATFVVTLASYHLFVRSTVIGEFLNGRRFDRALPSRALSPSQS
jgi:glucans biosynthesis protein C